MKRGSQLEALHGLGIRAVLDSLPDGAYVTDLERKILFWNRAAEVITGWTADEVVGRTCYDNVLCHVDQDGHALCGREHCPLHRSIVTGKTSDQSLLVFARKKDGERVAVEVSVAPLRDTDGATIGGIETFRDMSGAMEDLLRARLIQQRVQEMPIESDSRIRLQRVIEERDLVGGDLVCVRATDPDHYALLLLDVRGHGLAAALYTIFLHTQWQQHRDIWDDPARVLRAMNGHASEIAPDSGYLATAIAAIYNASTGQGCIARAGHPPPVVLSRADWRVLAPAQPALGLEAGSVYVQEPFCLMSGDSLFLYSDGAIESSDLAGEEIGLEGLIDIMREIGARDADLDEVPERLLARSGAIRHEDDLTMLLLTRR